MLLFFTLRQKIKLKSITAKIESVYFSFFSFFLFFPLTEISSCENHRGIFLFNLSTAARKENTRLKTWIWCRSAFFHEYTRILCMWNAWKSKKEETTNANRRRQLQDISPNISKHCANRPNCFDCLVFHYVNHSHTPTVPLSPAMSDKYLIYFSDLLLFVRGNITVEPLQPQLWKTTISHSRYVLSVNAVSCPLSWCVALRFATFISLQAELIVCLSVFWLAAGGRISTSASSLKYLSKHSPPCVYGSRCAKVYSRRITK